MTGTTAGVGNPVVSTAEDGTSLVLTILALAVPILAFFVVLVLLAGLGWLTYRAIRWARGRRESDATDG
ncbi:hypothetical protein L830_2540 [Mycobacteroides abscessus MAB_082312_2258]|nr:hypothetical protein L830_2540 [Mycobacteroides abscessus MAB_082312_2258]